MTPDEQSETIYEAMRAIVKECAEAEKKSTNENEKRFIRGYAAGAERLAKELVKINS